MRLNDKVAIITGGGTGIGKGIATMFALEGAQVTVAGRRLEPLAETVGEIKKNGSDALAVTCDVSKASEFQKLVDQTVSRFGSVDILVNNAGVYIPHDVMNMTEEEWDQVMAVDLKGVWFGVKAVLPHMLKKGSGKVINISSIAGLIGIEQSAAYCAAKGAVVNLTREMALDYAPKNIQVNGIAPGLIETDMTKFVTGDKEALKSFLTKIPSGRAGVPEDIAYAAVYLASSESDYMIGQTLVIDGGFILH